MKMSKMPISLGCVLLAGMMLANPVLAEKPDHAGQGKNKHGHKHERKGDHGKRGDTNISLSMYFGDRQRHVVHEYYAQEFRGGHCPPGLAKKRNGCMPPGQARKWQIGHRLPGDVIYYELPPRVVVELGTPPAGYKYVRVAKDLLLIAVGTSMVMDAIEDLGNL